MTGEIAGHLGCRWGGVASGGKRETGGSRCPSSSAPAMSTHGAGHGARSVLASQVEDVDAAYAELRSRGVEFIRPPEDRSWGLRCAHFKDPDGNAWELHTPLGEQ